MLGHLAKVFTVFPHSRVYTGLPHGRVYPAPSGLDNISRKAPEDRPGDDSEASVARSALAAATKRTVRAVGEFARLAANKRADRVGNAACHTVCLSGNCGVKSARNAVWLNCYKKCKKSEKKA